MRECGLLLEMTQYVLSSVVLYIKNYILESHLQSNVIYASRNLKRRQQDY